MLNALSRIIRFSFYSLFLFVPLILFADTSELFEFNKIWFTFALTLIIGACWIAKMILQRRIQIQRTPLDIPIILFLVSQILSTIFSLDPHVSWWGYYTRFNGGLLSMITYIFLYYGLVSNLPTDPKKYIFNLLKVSLFSGLIVALWGLPSHFGYDPTCLVFRGKLDVSCWTDAFQPKVRMFSTLGQPDWLAAYLSILIPISLVFGISNFKSQISNLKSNGKAFGYLLLTILFYVDFLYTNSKGSFIAQVLAFAVFFGLLFLYKSREISKKILGGSLLLIVLVTFFIGNPINQLNQFSYSVIKQKLVPHAPLRVTTNLGQANQAPAPVANPVTGEMGGSDSGRIRSYVWHGAIDIWLHNPLFGSGVETFAYAYYKYRPAGHNLTSEWDYLYNKAHNEYLNYLATTGLFGLGTYLAIIGLFLFLIVRPLLHGSAVQLSKKDDNRAIEQSDNNLSVVALIASFVSIIVSNFFGFSVVIVNMYFFVIPVFVFVLIGKIDHAKILSFPKSSEKTLPEKQIQVITANWQKIVIAMVFLLALYLIIVLYNFWQADREYGLGQNLDHVNLYDQAQPHVQNAVSMRPGEPVFKDELSINDAVLAVALSQQKDQNSQDNAKRLAQQAVALSDELTTNYPNNVIFWKTRVRIFYTLSTAGGNYLGLALQAIKNASVLAPTDAKIGYNLGLLYAQTGQFDQAEQTLKTVVSEKPDYRDAFYALGLVLHQEAIDKNSKIVNLSKEKEAVDIMHHILELFPTDKATKDALKGWGEN